MSNTDHLNLDGNTLKTFLTVLEEVSVSKAAVRLGVSQSAVSHTLDRLRTILDDPLFIRHGRGIVPTTKALSLRAPIEGVIGKLKSLTFAQAFDPSAKPLEYSIAANDFQLLFIFPALLKELYAENIFPTFHFLPSGVPNTNQTRASRGQFLITPAPPAEKCYIQEKIFESKVNCYYDSSARTAPVTKEDYHAIRHIDVRFSGTESTSMVVPGISRLNLPEASVTVSNFCSISNFIHGTDLVTIQPALFERDILTTLDSVSLPIDTPPAEFYLVWHRRHNEDPAHRWLRNKIISIASELHD